MDEIKIFVTHTPGSRHKCVKNPLFYHVMAGSVFQKEPLPEYMLRDDTGEHISDKNREYCELTTQFWAWKNVQADYYGFCHYRRYFSFAPQKLAESDCGLLVFPYLNARAVRRLHLQADDTELICRRIHSYDFLIAKGISVRLLSASSVYRHYQQVPALRSRDMDLFLAILEEKYPKLRTAARAYINGKVFYPCNMFLMKKELFVEYADILFDLLAELECRMDQGRYSREGCRTLAHLGERFLGIYYEYLRQKGGYHLGELQIAMFEHTQAEASVKYLQEEIPIVLSANQSYVPALYVCLKSLTEHFRVDRKCHIFIFHTDIPQSEQRVFQQTLANGRIRMDFMDVGARIDGCALHGKGHISKETYFRFLIPDILKKCKKVIYLDVDLLICSDISKLYDTPMKDCLLAAVVDADIVGQCNGANPDTKRYCRQVLRLKQPLQYAQAGVLVLDIQALRQTISVSKLLDMAVHGNYRYADQDIINIVCQGRIQWLDMAWNVLTDSGGSRYDVIRCAPRKVLEAYESAREHPRIIHYAGSGKPWQDPKVDFAREFWETARQTPYYEVLLSELAYHTQPEKASLVKKAAMLFKQAAKSILPKGSRLRQAAVGFYWRLK